MEADAAALPTRLSSRWMPPRVEPDGGEGLGGVMLTVLAALVWYDWRIALGLVGGFVLLLLLAIVFSIPDMRRAKRIAEERKGDSICTFARSFDVRAVDPWVLRAVYEELVELCGFPLRAEDSFYEELRVDPEDLAEAVVWLAARAGRSVESVEGNTIDLQWGSVCELVMFLVRQPRTVGALAHVGLARPA